MLDFFFIRDEQSANSNQVNRAGGIGHEEFAKAQELKIIESRLDYYGDFRWSSQQVRQKRAMLTSAVTVAILKQAVAAECGLVAFGD